MQVGHFHPTVGGFTPAAAQLNPPEVEEVEDGVEGFAAGLGSSQERHLVAVPGLLIIHTEQLQPAPVGGFNPAADQSNPFTLGALEPPEELPEPNPAKPLECVFAGWVKSKVGREDLGTANAAARAFWELGPGPAPGEEVGMSNEYVGRAVTGIAVTDARTSSLVFELDEGDLVPADP